MATATKVSCPGPKPSVPICVLQGFGSSPIRITYFKNSLQDLSTGFDAEVTVYDDDSNVLFTLTSPTRITLLGAVVENIVFYFDDSDFSGLATPAPLGDYEYRLTLTPTGGEAKLVIRGTASYVFKEEDCAC